jgi:hypothetical protein
VSEHNLPHIDITPLAQRRTFKSPGSNARQRALNRVREDHGLRLIAEIGNAFAEAEAGQRGLPEQPADLEPAGGVFIEVELNRAQALPTLNGKEKAHGKRPKSSTKTAYAALPCLSRMTCAMPFPKSLRTTQTAN